MTNKVGIIGAGTFGLTLAKLASENEEVIIYTRSVETQKTINAEHKLLGHDLKENVSSSNDLEHICDACNLIIPVIPSSVFRQVMGLISPYLTPRHFLIHGTKGLDFPKFEVLEKKESLTKSEVFTMSEVIRQETGILRVGCLAGPNLSSEILQGKPAATVIASPFDEVIARGTMAFKTDSFFTFSSHELLGTELVGAFKNIFAIASGLTHGSDMGKNAYGILITRAMREMIKYLELLGSVNTPALGMAGLGDLVTTSSSPDSRNFKFGQKIAKGQTLEEINKSTSELAEGVRTLKAAYLLSKEYNIDAPITSMLHQVVFGKLDFNRAVRHMMSYPLAENVDYM